MNAYDILQENRVFKRGNDADILEKGRMGGALLNRKHTRNDGVTNTVDSE